MKEDGMMIAAGTTATPELLVRLMSQMAFVVRQKEAKLRVEESGTEIAKMQGYLAGHRKYGSLIMAQGFDLDYRQIETTEKPWVEDDDRPDYDDLRRIHSLNFLLQENETYIGLKAAIEHEVEEKKNFLFYMSDKARDMHWCKGWYKAISQIESWIETLENEYALETKRREESLPFDD